MASPATPNGVAPGAASAALRGERRTCELANLQTFLPRHVFADGGARMLIVQPDPAADALLRPCQALLSTVNHRVEEYLRAHFRERPRLETLAAIGGVHSERPFPPRKARRPPA